MSNFSNHFFIEILFVTLDTIGISFDIHLRKSFIAGFNDEIQRWNVIWYTALFLSREILLIYCISPLYR